MVGIISSGLTSNAMSEGRMTSIWQNRKCFAICFGCTFAMFQYNFDTTLLNGFQAMPGFLAVFGYPDPSLPAGYGIDTVFQQLITSLLQVGLIFASFSVGPFSHWYGRRVCYWVGTIFAIAGLLIQIFVTSKGPIYLARLLVGFGNGIYVTATVLYISEVAPAHLRGMMVAMYQVTQNIGGLIGAIINNYTATIQNRHCYQIPIAILFVIPVFLFTLMFFIPETPRWLTDHNEHDKAALALRRLRGKEFPEELLQEELLEIREVTRLERELAAHSSFRDLFRGSDLRRTLLSLGASMCHSASGINFLVGYATYFLQISGISQPFKYSIVLQCVAVIAASIGLVLNKFLGRRTLFISGATITTITMFLVAIIWTAGGSDHTQAQGRAIVAMVNIYLAGYSYSIGPIAWVSAGEIPSNRLRSVTLGLAMGITFLFAWLTTFTLPYFFNPQHLGWGPKIGWIWGPANLIMLIWLIFFLPETKGRSLEEMDELFANKVSAWKFKKYKCVGIENAKEVQERMEAKGLEFGEKGQVQHHEEEQPTTTGADA